MISAEKILDLLKQRRSDLGLAHSRIRDVRDTVNGDVVVPLPELGKNEKVAVANTIALGLDQTARRVASTQPDIYFPPTRENSDASNKRARKARNITLGWWERNRMALLDRKRARWLVGYGLAPVRILPPDAKNPDRRLRDIPTWVACDPLGTYPCPGEDLVPTDVIFTYERTLSWLKECYPEKVSQLNVGHDPKPDDRFELVEYLDANQRTLIVTGSKRAFGDQGSMLVVLQNAKNRSGVPWCVIPRRICLDRTMGQFDATLGLYEMQAKLMALQLHGAVKGVYQEEWFVSADNNEPPVIVREADPFHGISGIATGGAFHQVKVDPAFANLNLADRMERGIRVTGGIPAEMGGEASSTVRTARRGDQIMGAAVDFTVQEVQDVLATAREEEVAIAIAHVRAFQRKQVSFYVPRGGKVTYDQGAFDTDEGHVAYSMSGTDVNSLTVALGQMAGVLMSKRNAMEMHPMVEDAEAEWDRMTAETLHAALLSSIAEQAASGAIPPDAVARITDLVLTDKMELPEAVMEVQREMQERQASPVEQGAPEAQPGLAMPGMGAEAPETIPEPEPNVVNLASRMRALRATAQVPA